MFKSPFKPFLALLLVFIFHIFWPTDVGGSGVIFQDNFDDGDSNGWIVPRNTCTSNWQVNNFTYGMNINSPCLTETIPGSLSIPSGISYSYEVDMSMTGSVNMDRNFVFKYRDSNNWYDIHTFSSMVQIQKVVGGVDKNHHLHPTHSVPIHLSQIKPTTLRLRFFLGPSTFTSTVS